MNGFLKAFWRAIAQFFASHDELQIHADETRMGQIVWRVYDPMTGYSASFDTETEVLIWLDQRFSKPHHRLQ